MTRRIRAKIGFREAAGNLTPTRIIGGHNVCGGVDTGDVTDGGGEIDGFVVAPPADSGNGAKTGNPNLIVDWQAPPPNNNKGGKSSK